MPSSLNKFIWLPVRFWLLPLTLYLVMLGGPTGADEGVFPQAVWAIPELLAAPFPKAFMGIGLVLGALVGTELLLLVAFVIAVFFPTPPIKALGLGKHSGGSYWKPGAPWPAVVVCFGISAMLGHLFIQSRTEVYTGLFDTVRVGSGNQGNSLLTIRKEGWGDPQRIKMSLRSLTADGTDYLCFFMINTDPKSKYTYKVTWPDDLSTIDFHFADPSAHPDRCRSSTLKMTSIDEGVISFADGAKFRLQRREGDMDISARSKADELWQSYGKSPYAR